MWNNKFRCRYRANSGLLCPTETPGHFPFLAIVAAVTVLFLVRYRSRRSKVHWKIMLPETAVIVTIAVIASLLIGGIA